MGTRMQLQHYRRLAREAEIAVRPFTFSELPHAVATGCECHECQGTDDRPAPAPVPSLVTVAGGYAVSRPGRMTVIVPFADPWGNGR